MCKPGFVFNTPNNPWLLEKCMIYGSENSLCDLILLLEYTKMHTLSHTQSNNIVLKAFIQHCFDLC